jgi:hypothetical protein
MSSYLYLFSVENYPEEIADPEGLLLIAEGLEDKDEDEITFDELHFVSTLAVHSNQPDPIVEEFAQWWQSQTGEMPKVTLLASEVAQMQEFRANEVASLDVDTWSIKTNFVAYAANCDIGQNAAINLIKESELQEH